MIRIFKFRKNDLNSSAGKQIEFNQDVAASFFNFTTEEVDINVIYKSLNPNDPINGRIIKNKLRYSQSRGDYKIYGNSDGSENMKDFFLKILQLNDSSNIDDYFALIKRTNNDYDLYYLPASTEIASFFSVIRNNNFEFSSDQIDEKREEKEAKEQIAKQVIYYGAPGTGKSHTINEITKDESVVRTTFHPDSDYSTFVGCYKPTTKEEPRYTSYGEKAMTIKDENGNILKEDRIVYEFVDQAFLQAYIKAWTFYAETETGSEIKKQFLVIEEINRGNCAQIFGDLFQLLDRNKLGFSDYPIQADNDIKKQLAKAFKSLSISQADKINACYNGKDLVGKVLSGEILLLPNNLYIWATMNTSDQSLFPIDSAFKRRWDWQYIPISKGRDEQGNDLNWKISSDTKEYDWWSFLDKINEKIGSITNSEDKKLGYFFCKTSDGCISAETFVGKVIFYLWNDVFKDFGFEDTIYNDIDGATLSFDKFYGTDEHGKAIVQKDKVELFLDNLGVSVVAEIDALDIVDEDGNSNNANSKDDSKYSINGQGAFGKGMVVWEAVKLYVSAHPEMSDQEIVNAWLAIGVNIPHLIETQSDFEIRAQASKDLKFNEKAKMLQLNDGKIIYVSNQFNVSRINEFMTKVNARNWGIRIEKNE